jgi:hypothetical protein
VPLEEMLATAGNPRNRRYTVERDSQVHPLDHGVTGYGARPRRERCAGTALHG